MIVGLTGGIGSGKSAAADILASEFGIPVIDADEEARKVVAPGETANRAIAERYPDAVRADGSLDRRWLRENVLLDSSGRQWLESIIHPAVRRNIRVWIKQNEPDSAYVVLVSPLLLETGQHRLCDLVVVVDASEAQQAARAAARDEQTDDRIRQIMQQQLSRRERLARADRVLDNTGEPEALRREVAHLHRSLLARQPNPTEESP